MSLPIDWLLEGEAWIVYRTRRDLLKQPEDDDRVIVARQAMLADRRVQQLLTELRDWPGAVIASHKSASQPFHKLTFLADLGLRAGDPYIDEIAAAIMQHQSAEGVFQLPMNIGAALWRQRARDMGLGLVRRSVDRLRAGQVRSWPHARGAAGAPAFVRTVARQWLAVRCG
jgi:hypothetical protein